jgi:DNA-binding IclR family transcriptional regulator
MPDGAHTGSTIRSLAKAVSLLRLFTPQRNAWTAEDMAGALGFHKSSVQRIIATLEQEGFLSRLAPRRSEYRLGPDILFLGNVAEMSLDLRSVARPIMLDLVAHAQETCYLCVADQDQCLYVEKVECSQPIRIINQVGQRNPMHCTGVGKALLSGMPDEAIDRLIETRGLPAHTRHSITDRQRLMQTLERIRRTGIAFDNEELNLGVKCVAAPIQNSSGSVVAAISLSGPSQRFTPAAVRRFEKDVRAAALEISKAIGFTPAAATARRCARRCALDR